jgi:hypothetical protein
VVGLGDRRGRKKENPPTKLVWESIFERVEVKLITE